MIGSTLAHYTILEPLGAGGMGAVYRAHDTRLGRDVALKVLPPELLDDPVSRARLVREARTASQLNHPHICVIHEVGEADGVLYIAMELVPGSTLQAVIPPRGLPTASVLDYGSQIAAALTHAHEHDVIHRDLKASNIVVTRDGQAKVLDFGIARRAEGFADPSGQTAVTLTGPGMIVGTPQAMAPEMLSGERGDVRTDLWSLGIVLYEMSCGRTAVRGQDPGRPLRGDHRAASRPPAAARAGATPHADRSLPREGPGTKQYVGFCSVVMFRNRSLLPQMVRSLQVGREALGHPVAPGQVLSVPVFSTASPSA